MEVLICKADILFNYSLIINSKLQIMGNIKAFLTLATIIFVPLILAPQYFIAIFIVILVCLAFRQRKF